MSWDRNNEAIALEKYQEEKVMSGNKTLVVTNSGLCGDAVVQCPLDKT